MNSIYCYITSPTSSTGSNFASSNYTNATLYVPKGTKALYQNTEGWNKFQNIVEFDATAVKGISGSSAEAKVSTNYSVDGKLLTQPQSGLYLQKLSNGKTIKVMQK